MTKKELFDELKNVPDDMEITIYDFDDPFEVVKISSIERVQIEIEESYSINSSRLKSPCVDHIKKYCAENENFNAIVLS